MIWELEVDGTLPASTLAKLGNITSEFPGDDELRLKIGDRRLTVPVSDCPELRAAVERLLT